MSSLCISLTNAILNFRASIDCSIKMQQMVSKSVPESPNSYSALRSTLNIGKESRTRRVVVPRHNPSPLSGTVEVSPPIARERNAPKATPDRPLTEKWKRCEKATSWTFNENSRRYRPCGRNGNKKETKRKISCIHELHPLALAVLQLDQRGRKRLIVHKSPRRQRRSQQLRPIRTGYRERPGHAHSRLRRVVRVPLGSWPISRSRGRR